jgi:hypothetical protein
MLLHHAPGVPMKKDELEELQNLLADARPPPWRSIEDCANEWDVVDGDGRIVVWSEPSTTDLAAAARNALPRLLAEREALLGALRPLYDKLVKADWPDFDDQMDDAKAALLLAEF